MLSLPGYDVQLVLHSGHASRVYRARRLTDGLPVILKCVENPSSIKVAKLNREYELGRFLRSESILRYYKLEKTEAGPVIVMEDFGGRPLTHFMEGGAELGFFLDVAIHLARILGEIHGKNVIHKDIKPDNFLMNPATRQIKVIDFGIACLLPSERATLRAPEMLEGTIGYMSPEQRGIANRPIDYRTDFYALGATFYHLLSGTLTAAGSESYETLNTGSQSYNSLNSGDDSDLEIHFEPLPGMPDMLFSIIEKCVAENPDDRYQTAFGLQADLERVRKAFRETQTVSAFKLGQQDLSQRLQFPQKLYGRDYEISRLMVAYKRCCENQRSYMVLVSGEAGIGKSSVIHEIQKPIVMKQGFFVSGRCGRFKKETPYDPFITVGKALVNQILIEPEFKVAIWKAELKKALGSNGKLVCDLIPELENLLGPQVEPDSVKKEGALLRFQRTYRKFIDVFARPEHPLTIFLDDLHWADDATLALLEFLLTFGGRQSLFLIGTYRFDGSQGAHLLISMVKRLGTYGELFETLSVSPLNLDDTRLLIKETLGCDDERAESFSHLVQHKTHGNPFFLIQFLKILYQKGLLYCNLSEGAWKWSLDDIEKAGLPEDIVELLTQSIMTLPQTTLELLMYAACIGIRFDLKSLMMVRNHAARDIAEDLMPALKEGWIQPDDEYYKYLVGARHHERRAPERLITYTFMHDYVQQAAYALLSRDKASAFHYAIGKHFFDTIDRNRTDRYLMEIVEHLHKAGITDGKERLLLAEWYLKAGARAGATAGFSLGLNYFQLGWHYMPADAWENHYSLALQLRMGAAEMAFLDGQHQLMKNLCILVEEHARETLDIAKVHQLKAQYYAANRRFKETLEGVSAGLELLDMSLPGSQPKDMVRLRSLKILTDVGGVERMANMQPMEDLEKLAAMQLLACAVPSAYFSEPRRFPSIALEMLRLTAEYGMAPESCAAFVSLGVLAHDLDLGYRLGQLSVELLDKLDVRRLRPLIYYNFACFLQHRKEHMDQVLILLRKSIVSGFEIRELEYACRCEVEYASIMFFKGTHLEAVGNRLKRFAAMTSQAGQERELMILNILQQTISDFKEQEQSRPFLTGYFFHEFTQVPQMMESEHREGVFYARFTKAMLLYHHMQRQEAMDCLVQAEQFFDCVKGKTVHADFCFHAALIILDLFPRAKATRKAEYLKKVEYYYNELGDWSTSAPMNRLHQVHLIAAERARAEGRYWEAVEDYDLAIALAHDNGFPYIEALAFELAGALFSAHGRLRCARPYLQQAMALYRQLGFYSKIKVMMDHYPSSVEAIPGKD